MPFAIFTVFTHAHICAKSVCVSKPMFSGGINRGSGIKLVVLECARVYLTEIMIAIALFF